jgi:hypothetical protein
MKKKMMKWKVIERSGVNSYESLAVQKINNYTRIYRKKKNIVITYDRDRARKEVYKYNFGPTPVFQHHQFSIFFRITKTIAQLLLESLIVFSGGS